MGVLGKARVVFDKGKDFGRGNQACVIVHGDPSDGKSRPLGKFLDWMRTVSLNTCSNKQRFAL